MACFLLTLHIISTIFNPLDAAYAYGHSAFLVLSKLSRLELYLVMYSQFIGHIYPASAYWQLTNEGHGHFTPSNTQRHRANSMFTTAAQSHFVREGSLWSTVLLKLLAERKKMLLCVGSCTE